MHRDTIKDKEYFINYLNYEDSRIEKFSVKLKSLIEIETKEEKSINKIANNLIGFYKNKIIAMYSMESNFSEIKKVIEIYVEYVEEYGIYSYTDMIDLLSFLILFEIHAEKSINILNNTEFDDGIVIWMKSIIKEKKFTNINSELKYPNQYSEYVKIINEKDINKSTKILDEFMNKDWYLSNKDMSWYDSHKSKNDIYNGYWSWLSVAIIKVKCLDINMINNTKYLPLDIIYKFI